MLLRKSTFLVSIFLAILMTSVSILGSGCSLINDRYGETCKTRAYTRTILSDYVSTRFVSGSPVRMAIIPFSSPANISMNSIERPGVGNELAWNVHARMLGTDTVPIVEMLNRQDWPGKKEEFFTGNFRAIEYARAAGYDLVMVGAVDEMRSLDSVSAYTKVIDTEAGITVWYGKTDVNTRRDDLNEFTSTIGLTKKRPDLLYTDDLYNKLAKCIVKAVTSEKIKID